MITMVFLVGIMLIISHVVFVQAQSKALLNIKSDKAQTNSGAYSYIETSDPVLTPGPPSGAWAYNRIAATTGAKYVEVGWIKTSAESNDPSAYYVGYDGSTRYEDRIETNLTTGTSYNYQVKHYTGNFWDIYFNQLGQVDVRVDINASTMPYVWVGSEVPNTLQNIGDSDDTELPIVAQATVASTSYVT